MKKILTAITAMSLFFLTVTAATAVVELKLSHSGPTGATNDEGAKIFKQYVESSSNGDIVINIFPNNQLGNEREQLEGVQMGTIQICSISTGTLSAFDPQMLVIDIPYLFSSKAVAYKFLDGPMGIKIREDFGNKTGTVLMAYGENGFRHFTNRVRPIRAPEDIKGLKMRTQENPAHIVMMKSLGATPTPIPFGELYTALSQGVVDGQENPVSLTESSRFHEVQKYMTLDGHFYSPFVLIVNSGVYDKLTPEQQKIFQDGAKIWSEGQRAFNTADEERALVEIKKAGVLVEELDSSQLAEFRKAARDGALPLIETEIGKQFLDEVLSAADAAGK